MPGTDLKPEGDDPMTAAIGIQKTTTPKAKPNQDNLGFGQIFSDHMFVMDYTEGQAGMIQWWCPTDRWNLILQ